MKPAAATILALLAACASPREAPRPVEARESPALATAREREELSRIATAVLDLEERVGSDLRASGASGPSPEALARRLGARSVELRERLDRGIDRECLDVEGEVDLALARLFLDAIDHRLGRVLREEDGLRHLLPVEEIGVLDPTERYLEPAEVREGLAALEAIADTRLPLNTGMTPQPQAPVAAERLAAAPDRLRGWFELARRSPGFDEETGGDLLSRALASIERLAAHVEKLPVGLPLRAGREEFVWLLRHRHMVVATPEEIAARGRKLLDETDRALAGLVAKIYPGKTVAQAIEALRDEAPTAEELPVIAREAMLDGRDFVIGQGLVTVPQDLRAAIVVPTSDEVARDFPFGGYGGVAPGAEGEVGRYFVSPGASWMTEEERRERLRGNHPFKTRVVAIHEMWPGHHLQQGIARRSSNRLRRFYYTSTYGEGWALYGEELMHRHGFYRDPRTRLAQLSMRRWRCARVVIDPSLHCGWMSTQDAIDFLVERAGLAPSNAEAEVRRYLGNPTRPFSYVWGWLEIEELRKECLGRGMTEREFHDRFLETGAIPLPLVRRLLLRE